MTAEEKNNDITTDTKSKKSLIFRFWENAVSKKKDLELNDSPIEEKEHKRSHLDENTDDLKLEEENQANQEKETPIKPPPSPNIMEEKYLEALRTNRTIKEMLVVTSGRYSDFMLDDSIPTDEQKNFFNKLQGSAKNYLEAWQREIEAQESAQNMALKQAQDAAVKKREQDIAAGKEVPEELVLDIKPVPPPAKVNATIEIKMPRDRMEAWAFIFPPRNEGAPLSPEAILTELKRAGINTNIDNEAVRELSKQYGYLKLGVVAHGIPPQDGKDGYIEELFPRTSQVEIKAKENNTVDYKDLNWLHQIAKGGAICNIIPPIEGVDGIRVTGEKANARQGREAVVPKGKNTSINENRTALIADIDGEVTFKENGFKVEQILIISGDIDNSTGNLEFIGDIIVNGDVRNGFTLKATGNITIKGMAESSQIVSGGNIQVGMGMNGNGRGCLEAKGDIKCKYLENCTVNAGGCVVSDSIVHCTVYSNDRVQVTSAIGSIIGGSVTAANEISANVVGNKSNRTTVLVLGNTPDILKEKVDLEKALKKLNDDLDESEKTLSYLNSIKVLTTQQKKTASEWRLKSPLMQMQKTKTENRLREINDMGTDLKKCRINCGTIYPPTQIFIGRVATVIQQKEVRTSVYYLDGEIHISRN